MTRFAVMLESGMGDEKIRVCADACGQVAPSFLSIKQGSDHVHIDWSFVPSLIAAIRAVAAADSEAS